MHYAPNNCSNSMPSKSSNALNNRRNARQNNGQCHPLMQPPQHNTLPWWLPHLG